MSIADITRMEVILSIIQALHGMTSKCNSQIHYCNLDHIGIIADPKVFTEEEIGKVQKTLDDWMYGIFDNMNGINEAISALELPDDKFLYYVKKKKEENVKAKLKEQKHINELKRAQFENQALKNKNLPLCKKEKRRKC